MIFAYIFYLFECIIIRYSFKVTEYEEGNNFDMMYNYSTSGFYHENYHNEFDENIDFSICKFFNLTDIVGVLPTNNQNNHFDDFDPAFKVFQLL